MKKVLLKIGVLVFWCGWPVLWVYFRLSKRTRLLLVCGEEFLVLRGWIGSGSWTLPGGGLHRSEDSVQGLIREVQEETGIVLKPSQIQYLSNQAYREYGFRFQYDGYVTELPNKPALKLQRHEVAAFAWQPIHQPTLRLSQDARQLLAEWLSQE